MDVPVAKELEYVSIEVLRTYRDRSQGLLRKALDELIVIRETGEKRRKARGMLESAEVAARRMAELVDAEMPDGWGFVLSLFSFNEAEDGYSTYISSLQREGAIKALRELADSIESRKEL